MNKNNTYIRPTLLLLCITVASPSFYLVASYQAPGKRGPGYAGPKRIRQTPRTPLVQPQSAQPIQTTVNAPAPIATPTIVDQSTQPVEKPETEPTVTSQSMQAKAQAAASSPGWLMTAYIVFLSTLNKSFGLGIEQSYKPLTQNYMKREAFLNLKNEAQNEATKAVKSGEYAEQIRQAITRLENREISPKDSQYAEREKIINNLNRQLNFTDQEQINSLTKDILKEKKIDADKMEAETSFGSIASKTLYLGLFNTATRLAGGLIGFGATMLLQSLMPTRGE